MRISNATIALLFLSASYFLSFFDRLLMSVVGEMVKHEFELSDRTLSLLTGASFSAIYGFFGIVAGWLVDRVNRKKLIAWALLVWSSVTMLGGFAQSFVQLALARAGVGIGEAANVPAAVSMIGDLYPPAKRPMALAIFYAGGMIGIFVCFIAATWVAGHYGWRAAFLIAGPPGIVLAGLIAWFVKEPAREQPAADASGTAAQGSSFKLVLSNPALCWLLLGGSFGAFTNLGVMQWLPNLFLRSHELSIQQVGLFFGPVLSAGMTAGILVGGWIGNRVAAKSLLGLIWLSSATMLAIIPVYAVAFWVQSLPVALAATFLGTALSVVYAPSFNAAWQALCDPRARGTAAGISALVNSLIGGAICTFAIATLSDFWAPGLGNQSLRHAMLAGLVFCLVAAALFAQSARLVTRSRPE